MIADERIKRNEDMGPLPDPTPVQPKRRYDPHTSRDSQRPLAPSVDLTGGGSDSSSLHPAKGQKTPPLSSSTASRFTVSSQAEQKAAASSAQVLAQGPQSPANRNVIHMQQQQQQQQQQRQQQQQQQQRRQKALHDYEESRQQHQKQQDQLRQQLVQQELEAREQLTQGHLRQIRVQHDQPIPASGREPQNISMLESSVPHLEFDERSRRILEQRYGQSTPHVRQDENFRPSDVAHHQSQGNLSRVQQTISSNISSTHGQVNPSPSSATSNMPPTSLTRIDSSRPNSVPAGPSMPPTQPLPPKKTSNIMSLLNSEPEEPKVSKRHSDARGGASTPDLPPPTRRYQPPSHVSSQQFARPATPSQLATQQVQKLTLDQQMNAQPRQDQVTRNGSMRDVNQGMYRPSIDDRFLQQSRSSEASYLPSSSSRPALVPLRDRGQVSPPAPHSRTSSYSSIGQHAHSSHHQEHRTSIPQAPTDSRLRPSPYTNLTPPQHQSGQQQFPPSQQQHPSVFNPPPQREIRQEDHHRSHESQEAFHRQQHHHQQQQQQQQQQQGGGPRPIFLEHRPPSHEDIQAMERQYLASIANQQQEAMQQQMRERRRQQEQEQELMRRREQAEREQGGRGLGFYASREERR